ncbi:MAG: B12-binding domain-containing radical SAM protein [Candidatus Scalinduaceae bacterium]
MNILLIYPSENCGFRSSRYGIYPPLGILSIAGHLKKIFGNLVNIKVLDQDMDECEDYKTLGLQDIVGIHANVFNYENVLEIAQYFKERGSYVVIGGPHSTTMWRKILTNQQSVDCCCIEEGEIPFERLVRQWKENMQYTPGLIPNLAYRNGKEIKGLASMHFNNLEKIQEPDRSFLDLNSYFAKFQKTKNNIVPFCRPTSIYSSKGCTWREKTKGGCIFCARIEKSVRFRGIPYIWDEIKFLHENYKVDHVWDISDDNLNDIKWFKQFVDHKPSNLEDLSFMIYSRVGGIKEDLVPYFKKLNTYEIYLGFETGDSEMLKNAMKGASVKTNLMAASLLARNKIHFFPSFVLGLPGESEKSLKNTMDFCRQIVDTSKGLIYRLSASILMPIPGSKAFNMLLQDNDLNQRYGHLDLVDMKELEKIWCEKMTKVDYETLQYYAKEINDNLITDNYNQKYFKRKSVKA